MLRQIVLLLIVSLLCVGSLNCKRNGAGSTTASNDKVLNVYIWTEYLPQSVIDDFQKRTGITVNVGNYATNEELQEKLQSGVADYDVVVPSDYMVHRLIAKKLLQPIDRSKLRGWDNLEPKLLGQKFDPQNQYSMPFFWGTTGIGYRKSAGDIDSWTAMFDPKYKGRILMLKDGRELFAAALRKMGKSPNETDPTVLAQAAELLKAQKSLVRIYDSDTFNEKLAAGDVDLAQGYSGQFAKVIGDKPKELAYVVPKEGGTLWLDNLCIPAAAQHPDSVYAFLNYVLEPAVAAKIAAAAAYATPNKAARQQLDPAMRDNPIIYAPDDVVSRCQTLEDQPEAAKLINRYMIEIGAKSD